jgi:hypothetical protein
MGRDACAKKTAQLEQLLDEAAAAGTERTLAGDGAAQ